MKFKITSLILLVAKFAFSQINVNGLTVFQNQYTNNSVNTTEVTPSGILMKTVKTTGNPYQIRTYALFTKEIDQETITVHIGFPSYDILGGYLWGKKNDSIMISIYVKNGEHKYFWFNREGNTIKIEYPAMGASFYSDYLLKTVFRGNNHDMSSAVNGFMPSKISQKELFNKDTLWMYESSYGIEAYKIIEMPDLLNQFNTASSILKYMNKNINDVVKMDLKKISEIVNDSKILKQIESLINWAAAIDLVKTPIYDASVEIENKLYEK